MMMTVSHIQCEITLTNRKGPYKCWMSFLLFLTIYWIMYLVFSSKLTVYVFGRNSRAGTTWHKCELGKQKHVHMVNLLFLSLEVSQMKTFLTFLTWWFTSVGPVGNAQCQTKRSKVCGWSGLCGWTKSNWNFIFHLFFTCELKWTSFLGLFIHSQFEYVH